MDKQKFCETWNKFSDQEKRELVSRVSGERQNPPQLVNHKLLKDLLDALKGV